MLHLHIHGGRFRVRDEDFKESEHPRAANGEFAKAATGHKVSRPSTVKWTKHGGGEFTSEEHARLRKLKIPPAWTSIKLSPDPQAALQVVGKDEKGRSQYRYSAEHSARAAAEKFARLKAFNAVAGKIVTAAQHDMFDSHLTQSQRDAAAVIKLISGTGFRIGSERDTKADTQAYGASTLTREHIKVGKDGKISFEFTGKKGVPISKVHNDPEMARYLRARLKDVKAGEKVFDVHGPAVRAFIKRAGGEEFKVKDFRTWTGTNEALKKIEELPVPQSAAMARKLRLEVGKHVAAHLGNTPTIALAAYIDPAVFGRWKHKE